jgi:hypothetical protein
MSGKMARAALCVLVAALVGTGALFAADEGGEGKEKAKKQEVTGTVLMACPKGLLIKIKSGEGEAAKELSFPVMGAAQDVVKGLKKGDKVNLTYVVCPKTKKDTVIEAKKVD